MKKIITLLSLAFVFISACLVYLIIHGVSLRTAPLIKPSTFITMEEVAEKLVLRLFPDFQSSDYVLWGVLPLNAESQQLLESMQKDYEKVFHRKVSLLRNAREASPEDLRKCGAPCWLLLPREEANELKSPNFFESKILPLNRPSFNVTWMNFSPTEQPSQTCLEEKRLDLECVEKLSVRDTQKKMQGPGRFFFLRKYNERDFFIFIQEMFATPAPGSG